MIPTFWHILDLPAGFALDGKQLLPCMDEMPLADKFYDADMLAGSIKCHGMFSLYNIFIKASTVKDMYAKILRKTFRCPDKHAPGKVADNDCNVTDRFGCV